MNTINFETATFKEFENIPNLDLAATAKIFKDFTDYMETNEQMNFRFITQGSGPVVTVTSPFLKEPTSCVSLVSNDYLNFTQHPKIKQAAIDGITKYGTGAGASPLIGGHHEYHVMLENKLSSFFGKPLGSSIVFTTGYTTNSSTLLALLKPEDCAIVDMEVHASVYEGLLNTTTKRFPHNSMVHLERALAEAKQTHRTRLVIIDGVYSQNGDLAKLDEIKALVKSYGAYLMVDDAHGIGVLGKTGRGAIEVFDALQDVDIISGTLSKAFGHIGGFIIASSDIINYLRYQSRQQVFSSTSTPATYGLLKAIDLIDEEPHWRAQLSDNVTYFRNGLQTLGVDIGDTASPIIPIKIGDPHRTATIAKLLLNAGVYANCIVYPGVAKKDARIRTSLMATHTKAHLDHTLNALEDIGKKISLKKLR
ncbi:aminotransferase class I/II-fold pyridoxal phosphate-dependent enzyme [Sphingobacterium sp. lm-10]|uniref:aminotransferase class I/II-fold pyridoxal phosphate-dependent enzyme n=1 Tax=Sphingobacterium sp. lm-10 TaxID=2944904 RepID=UPI0020200D25|nr:aminotransferase class I/II-fold pyridoxal phosphate-dependent enzyme [Sphingobacterium sp. lm-10]MCL7989334.1 aminotransferase class I/II-fold pyridoxal phosphate-dependent enzyme [Sphingobacterium sp. lm-10]